nr:hypothetical protein [Candidatus Sigynarchaeum springense]
MIEDIYIIHHESGVPLLHVDFQSNQRGERPAPDLFGGALQGIRLFLKECKIGDLNEFKTNDRRIEVRCDKAVVVAIVSGLDSPPHEIVDILVEDIGLLFETVFKEELRDFNGNVKTFEEFTPELVKFVNLQIEQASAGFSESESTGVEAAKELASRALPTAIPRKHGKNGSPPSSVDFSALAEWLKNRYGLDASIENNARVKLPPGLPEISVDALIDAGERRLNRLDSWLAPRMASGGMRAITFCFWLDPIRGPAFVRQVIEQCITLGDTEYGDSTEIYPWFPAEIMFIGPGVQKSTFNKLGDIIKEYKGEKCVIASYADHLHREHSPHHAFFRCSVTGWQWKPGAVTAENYPVQVFP